MKDTGFGVLLLIFAALMNASFTLPMKFTRRWVWENTWLAWTLLALLVLPLVITWRTVPHLSEVYRSVPAGNLLTVIALGGGWGVAQVLFGLAVDAIGIALTFSVVLGTSAAVGTLVPLLRLHPDRINTAPGHELIAGVALVLAGVLVCAIAGTQRERSIIVPSATRGTAGGSLLAVLCGLGASFVNLGLAFGAPLIQSARSFGASPLPAANAVWMPLMLAGCVPNIMYCLWLLRKNRTFIRFAAGGVSHWLLASIMAVFWFASTVLYGFSTVKLGTWGPILGWPLFMSLIVITASVLGILTGEWKNSGKSLRIQWAGVALLVLAVFVLSNSSRHLS